MDDSLERQRPKELSLFASLISVLFLLLNPIRLVRFNEHIPITCIPFDVLRQSNLFEATKKKWTNINKNWVEFYSHFEIFYDENKPIWISIASCKSLSLCAESIRRIVWRRFLKITSIHPNNFRVLIFCNK